MEKQFGAGASATRGRPAPATRQVGHNEANRILIASDVTSGQGDPPTDTCAGRGHAAGEHLIMARAGRLSCLNSPLREIEPWGRGAGELVCGGRDRLCGWWRKGFRGREEVGRGLLKPRLGLSGSTAQGGAGGGLQASPGSVPREAGAGGMGPRVLQPLHRESGLRTA